MLEQADLQACLDAVQAIAAAGSKLVVAFTSPGSRDELERLERLRPHLGDLHRITRALDDARAAWGVPGPAQDAPGEPLTSREREVMRWLAAGKTDRDIGDILGISPRTVHKHLQRIYEKLGVETRTAAVARFLQTAA